MSTRGSIFDSDDELDVSDFKPKSAPPPKPPIAEVRAIAEASNFRSREAKPAPQPKPPIAEAPAIAEVSDLRSRETKPAAATADPMPIRRQPRRHKTGRTMQLNVRTTVQTVEAFYAIADREKWLMGETVERALAALQRELESNP